jgi:orotate phosphoribosyltransferase
MALLDSFKKTGALLEGHFILRSGLRSRQYFQCALLLQHAKLASEICGELADKLRGYRYDALISPAMGGILVGQEVARHLDARHIFAEKQEGKLVIRRFEIKPGERFLVLEDVITTGSAVQETLRLVRDAGGIPVAVGTIVDRSGEQPPDFGVPMVSLLKLKVETFSPDALPEDLKLIPAVKPGSK